MLDNEAANPYDVPFVGSPGIPDCTGHWQPDTDPLSSFDGDLIMGTWRGWFTDLGGGDLAHVESIALHFKTIPAPVTGSKPVRAFHFAAACNDKRVVLVKAGWNAAFLSELDDFPDEGHDDQVDAAAHAFNHLAPNVKPRVRWL